MRRAEKGEKQTMFNEVEKARGSCITLYGNREAIIEGCKYVLGYEDNIIELSLADTAVRVSGAGLIMVSYIYEQAVITGDIAGIEFFSAG